MAELEGKVAIITGAGRGLGREYALWMARQGASVVVNAIEGGDEVLRDIEAMGGQALLNTGYVQDSEAMRALVDEAIARFGDLHIVVTNAGIAQFGPFGEVEIAAWQREIDINLSGTFFLTHWAAAYWRHKGPAAGRAVVMISSPAGTKPLAGIPAYNASKAGVLSLMLTAAEDLAPLGVRVNAVAPIARTPMSLGTPQLADLVQPTPGFDRFDPANIAPVVGYLASPRNRFTGQVFGVEGDSIVLHDTWNIRKVLDNDNQRWTIEAIDQALAHERVKQDVTGMFMGGPIPGSFPSDEALGALAAVAG